jgi:hypothetical protein
MRSKLISKDIKNDIDNDEANYIDLDAQINSE